MWPVVWCFVRRASGVGSRDVDDSQRREQNVQKRSVPGFEPGTSCTQSRNHTTRPNGHTHSTTVHKNILNLSAHTRGLG